VQAWDAALPRSPLHEAQLPEVRLHVGVSPVQSELREAEHAVQLPFAWQAGNASVGQASGMPAPWFAVQLAHAPAALQVGVVPVQAEVFVVEHAVHAPLVWQARAAEVGQGCAVATPLSPVHDAQLPVVVSQIGVLLAAPHWSVRVAEHCVHCPLIDPEDWHAGKLVDGHARLAPPESLAHGAHWPRVVSQVGNAGEVHEAEVVHTVQSVSVVPVVNAQ
jgi:hypothetical protein